MISKITRNAVVCAALLCPSMTLAFVPTTTCTESGPYRCAPGEVPKQVKWKSLCINWYLNNAGTFRIPAGPDGSASQALEDTITTSFEAWNEVPCQDLKLVYGGRTDDDQASTDGKANIVVFRDEYWAYASKTAFAITSVTYSPETGLIADADIELNAYYHPFTIGDLDVNIDVQNTVTHEVGHFGGLDHSPVIESTMYANAHVGETQKRTLETDDIEGICSIYPTDMRTDSCSAAPPHTLGDTASDDGGCCTTAPANSAQTPWILVLSGLAAFMLRRRRARA